MKTFNNFKPALILTSCLIISQLTAAQSLVKTKEGLKNIPKTSMLEAQIQAIKSTNDEVKKNPFTHKEINSKSIPKVGNEKGGTVDAGGGYFAKTKYRMFFTFLQDVQFDLITAIYRLPDNELEKLAAKYTSEKISKMELIDIIKNTKPEYLTERSRPGPSGQLEELIMDYDSKTKTISLLKPFFIFFHDKVKYKEQDLTATQQSEVRDNQEEVGRLILHEASHLFGIGNTAETDGNSEAFSTELLDLMWFNGQKCGSSGSMDDRIRACAENNIVSDKLFYSDDAWKSYQSFKTRVFGKRNMKNPQAYPSTPIYFHDGTSTSTRSLIGRFNSDIQKTYMLVHLNDLLINKNNDKKIEENEIPAELKTYAEKINTLCSQQLIPNLDKKFRLPTVEETKAYAQNFLDSCINTNIPEKVICKGEERNTFIPVKVSYILERFASLHEPTAILCVAD